jgi:hypothetical protein
MAQETQWFVSHGSAKAYLHVLVSFGQGMQSTHLKWSKDQTWVPRFLPYITIPFVRNLHKLESLTALQDDHNQNMSKEKERTHMQEQIIATLARDANTRAQEHNDSYSWEHLERGWIGDPVKTWNLIHKAWLGVSTVKPSG